MIRTTAELTEVCARLRAEGLAALDTEFVWRSTNRPCLALIQLGAQDGTAWALDCLLGINPEPLAELLRDGACVKVFHDAHQDLEHLFHYTGATPVNVFDTQLAAQFAGFTGKLSLQKLAFETVDVGLAKTETVTDWMQRPLTDRQMEYALDDVRYLGAMRTELLKRADALGTRAWLDAELALADDPANYGDPDPNEVWKRIKIGGRVRLDAHGFAILRAVAAVRESRAREWNLPRNWLGDDPSLVEMASTGAAGKLRLNFANRLRNRGQHDAIAQDYAHAVHTACALPLEECPENPHPHYIPEVLDAADEALKFMKAKAEELHLDPAVIANRATLTAYVDNPFDEANPLASGWRFEVVGREIAEKFDV